jgi:hypothetical protein
VAEQIDIDIVAHDKTSGIIQGIFQGIGLTIANLAMQIPGAIMEFGQSILEAANEAEAGLADLRQTLISTGGAAGMTEKELLDLAEGLSKTTKFSDDAVLSGENMLLTFTNIGRDVFPRATNSLLDLATKMKSDLPSAAIQLGKALHDPISGVTALRRAGVQLSDQQEEQIKTMMELGDVMGAQGIILGELEKEFGGQALAAGQTFDGQMAILTNRFNEMKETIGVALIPVLTELMENVVMPLVPFIEQAAQAFAQWISSISADDITGFVSVIRDDLVPAFFEVRDSANAVARWFYDALLPAFGSLSMWWADNSPAIIEAANILWVTLRDGALQFWNVLRPFVEENLPKLSAWWEEKSPLIIEAITNVLQAFQVALPIIIDLISALMPLLSGVIDIVLELAETVKQVSTGDWAGAWDSILTILETVVVAISDTIYELAVWIVKTLGFEEVDIIESWSKNWNQLVEIGEKVWDRIIESWSGTWDQLVEIVNRVSDIISERVMEFVDNLREIFSNFFNEELPNMGRAAFNNLGSLTGGLLEIIPHAQGGAVSAGQPYLVGEQGQELFVPNQSGNIIPNGGVGGGGVSVNLNYSPSFALGNRQEAENVLLPFILNGIRAAQANGYLTTP